MKSFFFLLLSVLPLLSWSQTPAGAWQKQTDSTTETMIIADGNFMKGAYTTEGNRFVSASGGIMKIMPEELEMEVEFDNKNTAEVGSMHLISYRVTANQLQLTHHNEKETWVRVDDGKPGVLFGAWLFSGRKANAVDSITAYVPGVRKTMKILSGNRFQWAAFNTETKAFLGTGGGTYTAENGVYSENIAFFSRDDTRVGAKLSFDLSLSKPHWYHSGQSSKGDPIFERWTLRNTFADQ